MARRRRRNKPDVSEESPETPPATSGPEPENKLVIHPVIPTWPTPAGRVLNEEIWRLQKIVKDAGENEKHHGPLQNVKQKLMEEHDRWQHDVIKAGRAHTDPEKHEKPEVVPYGSKPAKIVPGWPGWVVFLAFIAGATCMSILYAIL